MDDNSLFKEDKEIVDIKVLESWLKNAADLLRGR